LCQSEFGELKTNCLPRSLDTCRFVEFTECHAEWHAGGESGLNMGPIGWWDGTQRAISRFLQIDQLRATTMSRLCFLCIANTHE
jgi:hypothetical protein